MPGIGKISIAVAGVIVFGGGIVVPSQSVAQAACTQWDMSGEWAIEQTNQPSPTSFTLEQTGTDLQGTASYRYTREHGGPILDIGSVVDDYAGHGPAVGTIQGDSLKLTVYWNNNTIGIYEGRVGRQGLIVGSTYDANSRPCPPGALACPPQTKADWHSNRTARCLVHGSPGLAPAAKPTVALGRATPSTTPAPATSICEAARSARARNSPAAASLERQCQAQSAQASRPAFDAPGDSRGLNRSRSVVDEASKKDRIARGSDLASEDPLANELRNSLLDDARINGFDYGMAVAEGQTANGPDKQAIQDALSAGEQYGFRLAVQYSLDRNANADLAARGAAIVNADHSVMDARESKPGLGTRWLAGNNPSFYRLGFNIATGLFGDRALGAVGNRQMGPGSLQIRNALSSASAQKGFDDAVAFHLGRNYGY
ncbi:hypothetical protein [Rudaea sp.]|uniref:hypothetical protein n=1 Tax=Rudaea sp. TaxID=2136325 RepID=UPI00321FAB1B